MIVAILPLPLYLLQGSVNNFFSTSSILLNKILKALFSGAFLEELAKMMPIFILITGKTKTEIFDRKQVINLVLYATFLFAIIENILYSIESDFSLILLRFLSAIPLHMVATTAGIVVSLKMMTKKQPSNIIKCYFSGFIMAWAIHGFYNLLLILSDYYQSFHMVVLLRSLSILLVFTAVLMILLYRLKVNDENQTEY